MTISSKTKKILALTGGVALLGVCVVAMTKCSGNGSERDEALENAAFHSARADSLQRDLTLTECNRQEWIAFAKARGDTIRMLRDDTTLIDSIGVLNDSITHLVAANDSLQRRLNDCRGARRSAPRRRSNNAGSNAQNNNGQAPVQNNAGTVNNNNNNNNIILVPAQGTTNVNVNGGNGNTVNVNNGTVNNYYAPSTPSNNTVRIKSSASVSTTCVVKVMPAKTR